MINTFIAHRGLWNEKYPENSLKAFENAINNNIAIELDIQLTKDNQLIVFHDNNLKRITGVDKKVNDVSLEEIRKLSINNSNYQIPTFKEVLEFVNGQVLLDIEIKHYNHIFKTVKIAKKILKRYNGKYMIKSFNPLIPFIYKRSMKKVPCGILAGGYPSTMSHILIKYLKYLKYLWLYKPDFVCFNLNDINDKIVKRTEKYKIPLYIHTIKNNESLEKALKLSNTIIFEHLDITKFIN